MDQMRRLITTWDNIHEIIDKAMEKHDRWVTINLMPEGMLSVNVYPWSSKKVLAVDIGKKNRVCIFERR